MGKILFDTGTLFWYKKHMLRKRPGVIPAFPFCAQSDNPKQLPKEFMAVTPRWSRQRKKIFLETLRHTGNASAAAREAGVPLHKAYEKKDRDNSFRKLWQAAEDEALDVLEAELRRRAIEGTDKPVFYGGRQCGTVKSYNDNLAMFLLKARRRTVFGETGNSFEPDEADADPQGTLFEKLSAIKPAEAGEGDEE